MIPRSHPYIQNYLENRAELRGLGNALRIVVENPNGDIYDPEYREHAQEDPRRGLPHAGRRPRLGEVALGARRALDRGHRGGLPRRPGDARQLRRQRRRDRAAARQHRPRRASSAAWSATTSSRRMLVVPLLDIDPTTGQRIDYRALSHAIEKIRDRRRGRRQRAQVHVIGFAKLVGDLIDGLMQVALYFGLAALIAAVIIWLLHPLPAQHRAGDRLLAGRRGLAARAGRRLRLRARPVFDPGAVPGLRHRRAATARRR